jgi:hypothetical protein
MFSHEIQAKFQATNGDENTDTMNRPASPTLSTDSNDSWSVVHTPQSTAPASPTLDFASVSLSRKFPRDESLDMENTMIKVFKRQERGFYVSEDALEPAQLVPVEVPQMELSHEPLIPTPSKPINSESPLSFVLDPDSIRDLSGLSASLPSDIFK